MEFCFEVNPDLDLAIGTGLIRHYTADNFHDDTVVDHRYICHLKLLNIKSIQLNQIYGQLASFYIS